MIYKKYNIKTIKGKCMSSIIIQNNDGKNYHIKDIKSFYEHILSYHPKGISLHEENGHYFTVDDAFRTKIETLYRNHT